MSNVDVQFNWCVLSVDIDSEDYTCEVLEEMIKLWVTIRGFSTVSAWLEQYKASSKVTAQNLKGYERLLPKVQHKQISYIDILCI